MRKITRVLGAAALCVACSSDKGSSSFPDGGTGGAMNTGGGTSNTGGRNATGTGGVSNTGGAVNPNTGGNTAKGSGGTNTGGTRADIDGGDASRNPSMGGTSNAGGTSNTGGTSSIGGTHGGASGGAGMTTDADAGDASAPDSSDTGHSSTDGGLFGWTNSCAAESPFPSGTYELRVYELSENRDDSTEEDLSDTSITQCWLSRPQIEKVILEPDPVQVANGADPLGALILRTPNAPQTPYYEGVYPFVYTTVIDQDTMLVSTDAGTGVVLGPEDNYESVSFIVHRRSGFVTDYRYEHSNPLTNFVENMSTGSGVRICGETQDGGASLREPPLAEPPRSDCSLQPLLPGCNSTWDDQTASPLPTCKSSGHDGCTSCIDNEFGYSAVCCGP